jgi:hypothetical protein
VRLLARHHGSFIVPRYSSSVTGPAQHAGASARITHSEALRVCSCASITYIVSKGNDIVKRQLLLQESVERVNHKRVARLMRSAGLVGISRRKGFKTTVRDRNARPARSGPAVFYGRAARPAVGGRHHDVPTLAGFLFMAVVMDVFSRRIVGWAMATHLRTELILHGRRDRGICRAAGTRLA